MTTLAARDLSVTRGGATLLREISLSLGSTGAVALIGPNGAGKSTLLKTLAGLEPPSGGHVLLGERTLATFSVGARAKEIGFLPQHFEPHWDLGVAQLLELGAARNPSLAADALPGTIERFELAGLLDRRWSTLSGGERARALLASVLVVDPPILLADEPAAALDIRHRLDVIRALAARGRERSAAVVVHDLDLAFSAFERVVLMADGEIVADEPAARLIEDRRLDQAFRVTFERLRTPGGIILRAT